MVFALVQTARRRFSTRWLLASVWLAGLILYSTLIGLADARAIAWINDAAWTLAPAAAAWTCFRTARRIGRADSRSWWLLGAGCSIWLLGQFHWNYYELVLGVELQFPNVGQGLYLMFPAFTIAAITQLPESRRSSLFTLAHLGNLALVMCCLAVTVVLGLVEPALRSGRTPLSLWISAFQCLLIVASFLYALFALWTYRWSTTWGAMLLLVLASGIYAVCNLIYVHALLTRTYLPTDVVNMSWLLVFGLIAWSAAERLWLHRHPYTAPPQRMLMRERWLEAIVPALLIIIMVVVAVGSSPSLTPRVVGWAVALFILFAVVLGVREAWIQSDAQRLNTELVGANRRLQEANEELRNSENRYRDLNSALEQRVAERTGQLERAYAELEGFSYAVAHDLKAPLRAINGFAHLLQEELGEETVERVGSYLSRIRNGSLKMSALIDDLLSYSNIERRDLHASQIGAQELIQSVTTQFADEMLRRNATVTLDVEPITLHVDTEGLSLALRNLIENALKYSHEEKPPVISIRARRTSQGALLAIEDDGIGFDMQYHDHIFKVFQRLHRDDQYPGTGIGLALVRKAIERMGGRVWAQSRLGEGATFFIELPLAAVV